MRESQGGKRVLLLLLLLMSTLSTKIHVDNEYVHGYSFGMGFTKLFSEIVTSSIWSEDDKTRIVWVTMLALAGPDGLVKAAVPGLANAARVSIEDCEKALAKFQEPDIYSRSQKHEGRRIERIEGGFKLLNYEFYRNTLQAEERRAYKARKQAEYRASRKNTGNDGKPASGAFRAKERRYVKAELEGNQQLADRLAAGEA